MSGQNPPDDTDETQTESLTDVETNANVRLGEHNYEDALQILEDRLLTGVRVSKEWKDVERAAQLKRECKDVIDGKKTTTTEVIHDLRERNPGVPPWAFVPKTKDPRRWRGMRDEWAKRTKYNEDDWDDAGRLMRRPTKTTDTNR